MKQQKVKSLGVDLFVSVPATAEEFDQLAKRTGACVEEANSNVIYRSVLAEFRDGMINGLVANDEGVDEANQRVLFQGYKTRFGEVRARKQKESGKLKKDGKPILTWDEGEEDYLDYIRATHNVSDADFALHAAECMSLIAFDPAKTVSIAKPKVLAAEYLENGKKIYAAAKFDEFNKRLAKHGVLLQGKPAEYIAVEDADPAVAEKKNIEQLGWLVKAFLDKASADAKLKASQGLGV